MPHNNPTNTSFYGLGLAPKLLQTLERLKFTVPTPIQHKAIPVALEGKDIIGIAQTGTGKTLAFVLPIIQRLTQERGRCLIITPTRELAIQAEEVFQKFGQLYGIQTAVLIGGASMQMQLQALRRSPRVLIATPGRLLDHLNQSHIDLRDAIILVLDEADRMLDMGFAPDVELIIKHLPKEKQVMLFSATMPQEIVQMATRHMKLPVSVEIAPTGTAAEKVTHELFIIRKETKTQLLGKILAQYKGSVLIFSRTKIGAFKISRAIKAMGHRAAEIHSDRSLMQRREALEGFKSGKYRILVATDIAARGIDVKGIELVVNYDVPEDAENYVHRIGRTGRAGHEGHAIAFATPDQGQEIRNIEKLMRTPLPVSKHPELPTEKFHADSRSSQSYRPSYHKKSKHPQPHAHSFSPQRARPRSFRKKY